MKDFISYCENIEALRTELINTGHIDEDGNPLFPLANSTPTQTHNHPETVTLIRCVTDYDEQVLRSFESVEVLGTYDEVFADDEKYAKYSSAYPHDPYTIKDPETGEEITITPPKKFGVFA